MPAVDMGSFGEPYLAQLETFLRGHHRTLWTLDLTNDLNVPAFATASRRIDGAPEQILFGFGAHLDARIALLRAVTEHNQMLSQILYAPADSPPGADLTDKGTVEWLRTATVANQPYLLPGPGPARVASDFRFCRTDDLKDDVLACDGIARQRGTELLVLDLTRREVGLPVVKVVVPGLRHFWTRFAPGRLYDVPVRLGWLQQPLREEDLNPIPMFL
ncbi:MAG: YcaO-like family protein [Candidatus Riflebacteria bacterium]|nr:YcaO-like family protein [Candidatus Riflebacteria bacterium]